MPLTKLDHVNINCADLMRSRAFYADVLGMTDGDRPPFPGPGAWLYIGDRAVVHLNGDRGDVGVASTGNFDHVAFDADDIAAMRVHLNAHGIGYEEKVVPGRPLKQIFVRDPDGVMVELNFRDGVT